LAKESETPRIISPPIDQLDKLRQPLTRGEWLVFDFFNEHLGSKWEIYIHPHMNGLRPDFVLLNPNSGIAVFEVKDWNLDSMNYMVEQRIGKPPLLLGEKDGKVFSLQSQNPVEKILNYKQEIYELYCPRLEQKSGYGTITAGIIFPFAEEERVKNLLEPCLGHHDVLKYPNVYPISGKEMFQDKNIGKVFPKNTYNTKSMSEDKARDLRRWLIEPDFASTQRKKIELDLYQQELVKTRTASGYRRIKGPAGSGKSIVLASRAAELINEGKEVLVVTFNITLLHYLKDIAVRWPVTSGSIRKDITWLNFHHWCKRVCIESDNEAEYSELWRNLSKNKGIPGDDSNQEVPSQKIVSLVSSVIDDDKEELIPRYDAILVDEGQDFMPDWWNVLRKVCRPDGEMLLVVDATQDIYDIAKSWTNDAMTGAGFRGNWYKLEASYRLPPKIIEYAEAFAKKFLPQENTDIPVPPQNIIPEFYPCKMKWIQTDKQNAESACVKEILSMSPRADPDLLAIPDITFLTANQEMGFRVVRKLYKEPVRAVHTFYKDSRESRRKKMGFYMGDARVKATTIHSFKGWESRSIVIYTGQRIDKRVLALIYSGLTRLKRHEDGSYLTVVSCASELQSFGRTWPEYEER
jgi:hypothetical protein